MGGERVVCRQLDRDLPCQGGKAARHVEPGEFVKLGVGSGVKTDPFDGELCCLPVLLGAQLRVLNRPHGERPGHQPGEPGERQHT